MVISVVDPAEPVIYASTTTPSSYVCGDCGKSGVKLWRDYQTFLEHQSLRCADCAATYYVEDISTMKDNGKYVGEYGYTDQIGWCIPAVPTEENDTFWGYSSTPQDGCDWWGRLPVR